MNAKTIILTASVLLAGLSGRAQDAMTAQPDSLGRVERLREATVGARRELVTSDADKLTYNVEADPQAAGSSLIDILRRVPMVSVNGEEKVLLNGSTDYKVLVNGRPTGMLARNFAQLVKTFPASSVKEIQVITNPPVKYDAEGIGGLINIVLVRRLKAGYSGSVGLQAGTLGMAAGNGYLSAQLGKFAVSASAGGMRFPNPRYYGITDIENLTGTARRYQRLEFEDDVLYSTGSFSLEASYEPDSLNLITLSGWVDLQRTRESFRISERFWDADRRLTADMQEPRQMYNRGDSFSGELAYQRTFQGDGGVLTLSYAVDGIPNGVDNDVTVVPVLGVEPYRRHSFNTANTLQHFAQADYFATLRKKHQLEAGAKYTLRSHTADSQDELWDFEKQEWRVDNGNVNDLDYRQHIFAAYASYGYKFARLTLKAGARLEYTLNRGLSKSASGNLTFDNRNFNVVPYLNAAWQFGGSDALSLSYTRRLGRPSVSYLNPYIFEETPFSRSHGNPDLRTVVSDALTLTYRTGGDKWGLTARTYGSLCGNKIEYLSVTYPDGTKVSTYENAVRHRHADALLNFDWEPTDGFGMQVSGNVGYDDFYARALDQRNGGWNWSVDFSANAGLWREALAYASAFASGGETTLQRTYHGAEYAYSIGLQQRFFQGRMTLSATAVLPFQNRYEGASRDTEAATYRQHNASWYNPRQFRFGLTWRFGKTEISLKRARKSAVNDKL